MRTWLLQLRNERSLTQEDVAARTGIQRAYYTQIENGTRNPSVTVARRLADVLGCVWTLFFDHARCEVTHKAIDVDSDNRGCNKRKE
ncbi:MAG: helix-turn-helix transcriptional regulator [Peptococcaceae bacterium]|nr:helix-turn-helix transcriptional regulator [Peptococcaceae bacterium]